MINVTMEGAAVCIRPVGPFDAEMAATITMLLASARTAGTEAVLDVSGLDQGDRDAAAALAGVTPASVA